MPWYQNKRTSVRVQIIRFFGRWAKVINHNNYFMADHEMDDYTPVDRDAALLLEQVKEGSVM